MSLLSIRPPVFDVDVALAYATPDNFTGRPVYRRADCWLRAEAADHLKRAIFLAGALGLRLRIFDAFRPQEAQRIMWNHTPDPVFLADPERGSSHSRGVAVDLTLTDSAGHVLDMGTAFDAFTPLSHHGNTEISAEAQKNRHLLLGLMSSAGWMFYAQEWWHYQLPDAQIRFPLLSDSTLTTSMMALG
jgi:D-alanyl-D-alanine dipeptidase